MGSAATIVFARADLSIPGAPENPVSRSGRTEAAHARFFKLVGDSKPDVIVLDFTRAPGASAKTITTVHDRTNIPILVVCNPTHSSTEDYRRAGAADCISAPVDIPILNQAVQQIMRVTRRTGPTADRPRQRI